MLSTTGILSVKNDSGGSLVEFITRRIASIQDGEGQIIDNFRDVLGEVVVACFFDVREQSNISL